MTTKQTALEWLEDKLIGNPHSEEDFKHNIMIWGQAKQMEKEQIKDAFDKGYSYYLFNGGGEQYYNEIYNQKQNDN
jgi:hypothetical protein